MQNRHTSRFINDVLKVRDWSEAKLASHSGIGRSTISMHLTHKRKILPDQLVKYLLVLDHTEIPKLLVAWLRDNFPPDLATDLINENGDDVAAAVREFVPALDEDQERMLAWLAREMARDRELADLFHLLSARAGYRPKRTAASPAKRRHPRK